MKFMLRVFLLVTQLQLFQTSKNGKAKNFFESCVLAGNGLTQKVVRDEG
jgi:hypothetical protein